MEARKVLFVKEIVRAEAGGSAARPIARVPAIAVIASRFAGRFVEDLSPLFDIGMGLGEELMAKAVALLDGPPVSYGKAAIVGVNGGLEHAPAALYPSSASPCGTRSWANKGSQADHQGRGTEDDLNDA